MQALLLKPFSSVVSVFNSRSETEARKLKSIYTNKQKMFELELPWSTTMY